MLAPAVLQVLVCPWWLFSSQRSFVLTFLNGYAIVTGAIAGVLLSDFWVLKRGALDVKALYEPSRCFRRNTIRSNGADGGTFLEALDADMNWRAFVSVGLGCFPCLPGFIAVLRDIEVSSIYSSIYSLSWFVSFIVSSATYCLLNIASPRRVPSAPQLLRARSDTHSDSQG